MTMIICCSCDEHYGGDPLACAKAIACGTTTPCSCDCHRSQPIELVDTGLLERLREENAVLKEQFKVACERSEKWKDHAEKWQELSDARAEGLQLIKAQVVMLKEALKPFAAEYQAVDDNTHLLVENGLLKKAKEALERRAE